MIVGYYCFSIYYNAFFSQGIDINHKYDRKVVRREPKSEDVYLRLVVKVTNIEFVIDFFVSKPRCLTVIQVFGSTYQGQVQSYYFEAIVYVKNQPSSSISVSLIETYEKGRKGRQDCCCRRYFDRRS